MLHSNTRLAPLVAAFALAIVLPLNAEAAGRHHRHSAQHVRPQAHRHFLGLVPHRGRRARSRRVHAAATGDLACHGGPVMTSDATHAIFWAPPGFSFPPGYEAYISQYFQDVAHDSGGHSNVYSVSTQYSDPNCDPIAYSSTFTGAIDDTDALPSGSQARTGCNPPGGGPCLSDAQLRNEINHVISVNSLQRGLSDIYFIFTPPGLPSCAGGNSCSFDVFCAYHDATSGPNLFLYANQPYPTSGCFNQPNTTTPSFDTGWDAASAVSIVSHEHNETITDPTGLGWWDDSSGDENGDKCNFGFGAPIGGTASAGTAFNQQINGHDYYLQLEWSNATHSCQAQLPPKAAIAVNQSSNLQDVSFNSSASVPGSGSITSTLWDFGDGTTTSTAANPSHHFANLGVYDVKLTITDGGGLHDAKVVHVVVDHVPTCSNATATTTRNTAVQLNLSCADSDAGDSIAGITVTQQGAHGTASGVDSATGAVTYTPAAGFTGTDTFHFKAIDTHSGRSAVSTATVKVLAPSVPPPAGGGTSGSAPPPATQPPPALIAPILTPPALPHVFAAGVSPQHPRTGRSVLVRWTLDVAATTTVKLKQLLPGRSVHGRCLAPSRRNKSARACTRAVPRGRTRSIAGNAGTNSFRLSTAGLRPGRYRLEITPVDPSGRAVQAAAVLFAIR